ncbi:hypothetical protein ACG92T_16300, partial [Acinetobacter ursingii]
VKIALGFRYAQTLLNLAFARFGGQFFGSFRCEFEKSKGKSKSNSEFASLIKLYARFARSRLKFLHLNFTFLG